MNLFSQLIKENPQQTCFTGDHQISISGFSYTLSFGKEKLIRVLRDNEEAGFRYYFVSDKALGSGGVGEVYQAMKLKVDKDYILLPGTREYAVKAVRHKICLQSEEEIAKQLDYMHAKTVLTIGEEAYFVMAKIENRPVCSIDEAFSFTLSFLENLRQLHKLNIAHRDLHPANILFDGKVVRTIDFNNSWIIETIQYKHNDLFRWYETSRAILSSFKNEAPNEMGSLIIREFDDFIRSDYVKKLMTDDTFTARRTKTVSFSQNGTPEEYNVLMDRAVDELGKLIQSWQEKLKITAQKETVSTKQLNQLGFFATTAQDSTSKAEEQLSSKVARARSSKSWMTP
ncbi:hypothetical protein SDA22_01625 [Legionella pneumophila serogroup 1]|uniref:protein kinase domain-containing protein n=1 Tax=Legionella pneumophila TaxID=446 RepID=UPI0018AB7045|nr:hypothetical protein [Legionella pneumophila]